MVNSHSLHTSTLDEKYESDWTKLRTAKWCRTDGRTDGRTHHSRALYIINYIVNSDACVDAHLKTKLVYYLVYIYRLLRNCILSGCHFGTGIIIRHNVKSWLLCVIYWPFHMKIILPIGEINFLQEIFKNPKGFSRIIFRIKQKVFLQEFYSNKYFFFIGNKRFQIGF